MKLKLLNYLQIVAIATICILGISCSKDDDSPNPQPCTQKTWYKDNDGDGLGDPTISQVACEQPDGYVDNGNDDDDSGDQIDNTGEDLSQKLNGSDVMMQAFYWDVEPRGGWYNVISSKIDNWSEVGVGKIWLPAPGKGASGGYSMGYDPYDYFDVGEFDQKGTVETRFGSRAKLEALISKAHSNNIEVIADIIIGHNHGADAQEVNPNRNDGALYWTKFTPASGKFNRTYEDFHPNSTHNGYDEEASFFPENDLCHEVPNVQNWLWKANNSVAKFYKNDLGFDGWRFDYVKSFHGKWVKAWMDEVGGFAVGEYWDGNRSSIQSWINSTESTSSAFDFATFYRLQDALDNSNLSELESSNMLWKHNPFKAVTFVANHDTEKDSNAGNYIEPSNKLLAHAYLLTHEGYPCLFFNDYENFNWKEEISNLILIHNSIAYGTTDILYADNNEYIARRNGGDGHPGLIIYISFTGSEASRTVETNWGANANLVDYSGNLEDVLTTDSDGKVTVKSPAGRSYAIWSLQDF